MVLIALLLVALVCLALGLVLASPIWLIASLVASAVAALVLWRVRAQLVGPRGRSGPAEQASEPDDDSGTLGAQSMVWVIDGRPRYHLRGCMVVAGDDAEQIPYPQAVADGFVACPSCLPHLAEPVEQPAEQAEAATPPASDGQVWVVDGRPRYHLADCMIIEGQPVQAIPMTQATEDGFMPCSLCEPTAARLP
jgi:hypothetical protein